MSLERLPQFKYTTRDFTAIRTELESWVQTNKPELWNDFFESNLGEFLIQLIAYHGDLLSFAIDRVSEESFLASNRLYKSAIKHAKMLSYKPLGATSASVDVAVTTIQDNMSIYGVIVRKGTTVTLGNDLVFETPQDYTFPAGSTVMEFTLVEGSSTFDEFISTGDTFMRFNTSHNLIIDGSWRVFVDNVEWEYVEYVELQPVNSLVFSIEWEGDRALVLRFGDGVTGAIPLNGATIRLEYRVGGGIRGNVPSESINTTVAAEQNGSGITIPIINNNAAAGGSDRETLAHIQRWAPLNVRTVDKAITSEDYDTESSSFADSTYGRIARAKSLLREGTLAIPDPVPAEQFNTVGTTTGIESLGNVNGVFNNRVAMGFKLTSQIYMYRLLLHLLRVGTAGIVEIRIESDNAGVPSGNLIHPDATMTVGETEIGSTLPDWFDIKFNGTFIINGATQYWIVLALTSDPGIGNYIELSGDSIDNYLNGNYTFNVSGGAWAVGSVVLDAAFQIKPDPYQFLIEHSFETYTEQTLLQSLGNETGGYNDKVAIQFTTTLPFNLSRVQLYMLREGFPENINIRIETDNAGAPSGNMVFNRAFGVISASDVYGEGWVKAVLDSQGMLVPGTYWIVLTLTADAGSGHYYSLFGTLIDSYAGGKYVYKPTAGVWTDGTEILDAAFRLESGGIYTVQKNDPINISGLNHKALSEFKLYGRNIACFIDPNTVDVYTWVETTDNTGRRNYTVPSSGLKSKLLEHLDERSVVTTTVFIQDGVLVPINLDLGKVIINPRYDLSVMDTTIKDNVEEFFMDDSILPGDAFRISDFYDKLENIPGLEHFVERLYFDDILVGVNELIQRGSLTFTLEYPPLVNLKDITARY